MRSALSPVSLVGREDELRVMGDLVSATAGAGTRTVVVAGEAGIGKTRLVSEFVATLPVGTITSTGQSIDLGSDAPPYAPMTGLLRGLHAAVGTTEILAAAGVGREALSVLMPELASSVSRRHEDGGGAEWLYDSVAVMLENLSATGPLVLIVEDAHWADQASIGLLRYLVRVLEQPDILFVLTYRTDDVRSGPLHAWLPELDRSNRVTRIDLAPLSRGEVRDLANAFLDSPLGPEDLGLLYERSDGVPFLVEELVGYTGFENVGSFPPSLRGILLARYDTLTDRTQRIVRLLAAGGMRVEHVLLASVYGGDPDALDQAAREAIAASVLVVEGTSYRFRHALVREAIHDELLPGERTRFHSLYARALEAHGGLEGTSSVAISHHWMAAHDMPAAFSASLTAMDQAQAAYAFTTAARMGERALELWHLVPDAILISGRTRVDLLGTTSYALRNAGESERAIALVNEALADSADDDPHQHAGLLKAKASYLANLGRAGSTELLREALLILRGGEASVLRASVLGELAARLMLQADFDEAVTVADAALVEAESVGSHGRMSVAANIRGTSLISNGQIERGLADFDRASELAGDDDSSRMRYWLNLSDAMTKLGRFAEAITLAEEGVEYARLRGMERTKGAMLMSNLIEPLFALGQWKRATELLDRALELNPPLGYSASLQELKLWSTLWSGSPATAERLLRDWREPLRGQRHVEPQGRPGLASVAGEIALETGNVAQAWAEVGIILSEEYRGQAAHDLPLLVVAARVLATIRAAGGIEIDSAPLDVAHLEHQLRSVVERYRDWPTHPVYAALVDAEIGGEDPGDDVDGWRRALTALSVTPAPTVLVAWARVRLAESLAAVGDRPGALAESEQARSEAEIVGAGLIVNRVESLQRRAGLLTATRAVTDDGMSLTGRERQVLALVAQGLSNRQIADHLFISAKTASVHVSAILRKLGASTRTEAVYFAQQEQMDR